MLPFIRRSLKNNRLKTLSWRHFNGLALNGKRHRFLESFRRPPRESEVANEDILDNRNIFKDEGDKEEAEVESAIR